MTDLAKALRYLPGHKSIIFFSSGVPYSLVTGILPPRLNTSKYESFEQYHLSLQHEDMLKELSAANCAIYALDTQEQSSTLTRDLQTRGALSLQKLTNATGGKYFGNINNYEQHLENIQDLTGCYYVVGYYIDEKWDGAYHKIKVEVDRPGCRVHAQKGYFNPKPFNEYSDLEKMLHLVDLALSERPLFQTPVRFSLTAFPCSLDREANLCLIAKIPFDKTQEVLKGKFEIISVLFDEKENIIELRRGEKTHRELPGDNLTYYSFFSLKPGKYKCRLVIRNLETGKGAVAASSAVVEREGGKGIQLFPPLVLSPDKNSLYMRGFVPKTVLKKSETFSLADYFHFDANEYSPYLEDSLKSNSLVPAVLECSTAGIKAPEIKISASLSDESSAEAIPLAVSVVSRKTENNSMKLFINLHIPDIPTGEYLLNIVAEEQTSQSASQATRIFKIR